MKCWISVGLALAVAPVHGQSIKEFWQTGLKDASFTARVETGNQRELAKINRDFANSYRFKYTIVRLKEPFKLRLESKVDDTDILFIVNGTKRMVRIPRANLHQRENLAHSPGKRQTLVDFGMLAPSLFEDLFKAKFVRNDRASGDAVFDLTYFPNLDDSSRNRIWVDKTKHYISKREWYSQNDGRLLASFVYDNVKEVNGVWFPTRVTVRNADNHVAGITQYEGLKINTGLADSLFKVD